MRSSILLFYYSVHHVSEPGKGTNTRSAYLAKKGEFIKSGCVISYPSARDRSRPEFKMNVKTYDNQKLKSETHLFSFRFPSVHFPSALKASMPLSCYKLGGDYED